MVRVYRPIMSSSEDLSTQTVFSPKDVYAFLMSIDELKDKQISFCENGDCSWRYTIGTRTYAFNVYTL